MPPARRKPPTPPAREKEWEVRRIARETVYMGTVLAPTKEEALRRAIIEFKVPQHLRNRIVVLEAN